jgi:4-amino-4-deoxy-L-arabinose transferase-like glycosyltransferase
MKIRSLLGWSALVLWGALLLLWLLDALGHGLPAGLDRAVAIMAMAAGAGWIGVSLARRPHRTSLLLPALIVLSLAVRLVGIDHEVEGRYYDDEGTYYHHATKINGGEVLRFSFVYPHLMYYADAFALWLASLFPGATARLAAGVFGVEEPLAVSWLLLRGVVALLSALTVVPVFRLGERFGGRFGSLAGALAALLLIFSPLYNDGSHLNICDVPSAFFATLCLLFVGRLVDGESTRDYLLAGIAAGLAAGSKYPAGVVAVAIVGVWLFWRIARRDFRWGLLWAGLAALAAFVTVMPSLLFFPGQALWGGRGIFFGARQYSQGGWLGVMPGSNTLFYAENLAWSFGLPALIAGITGLFVLDRERLRRLLWMLPFPAVFLWLIFSMNMVVRRNLYPAVPVLAVFLGIGIAAWIERLMRPEGARWRQAAAALLVALCLAFAVYRTVQQNVGLARPSTRDVAAEWIRGNVPPGVTIVKESYTPDFRWYEYNVLQRRFAARFSPAELRDPGNDYVLLASAAYGRFQQPERFLKPHHREFARRYRQIFQDLELVESWRRDAWRLGPELRLYRLPEPAGCGPAADLRSADAFVPDGSMRPKPKRPIQYTVDGQWSLFKGCFDAGDYRVTVRGEPTGPGELRVVALDGTEVGKMGLDATLSGGLRLPRRGKYLFYVALPVGSRVRGVAVESPRGAAG